MWANIIRFAGGTAPGKGSTQVVAMEELVRNIGQNGGHTVLLKDSVESKGSFMVHYLLAKLLSPTSSTRVVLLGLSDPYTHYTRIARKQGCNLQAWRDKGRFVFIAMSPDVFEEATRGFDGNASQQGNKRSVANLLASLYIRIRDAVRSMDLGGCGGEETCIIIDDVSVLDVMAGASQDGVLDFLHYCGALRAFGKQRCSVVLLAHQDAYEELDDSHAELELEHISDTVISVEPLSTGLAADVHGQLTMHHRRGLSPVETFRPGLGIQKLQFRIMENGVQFFLPGQP